MREITVKDFSPDSSPVFPLLYSGCVWYTGWDIPGYWAIDANKNGFADFGAHGLSLSPCKIDYIIDEIETNGGDATKLREIIKMKPKLPDWVVTAWGHGWTPPHSFNRDDYE